ncbi:NAD(P)H-dependent oxidoreductase [Paraglaciecola aquimarina]|uniref:NAD(P)H-dependent oxidoreductase n=1 Tax=Paraglaciecola aquimarina TaxID=1235557 RepID=A0ABU3SVM5_9ALTE|nr:NAD(P)H-dependent oxidoreductase [Paraglaciecola aquimarina]MDU0354050.1 NAD(P)H-dependent oxidoreductase [Paraglaciecola aquimarina]
MSSVIILGSSRSDGNTAKLVAQFSTQISAEVVDLSSYNILPYDYEFQNQNDDFLPLIDRLLTFDRLILASPVYWYSPSGTMKVFLDRLCDLLDIYKPRGRALKNKTVAVLATGSALSVPDCFEQIFSNTFEYLDMSFQGLFYSPSSEVGNLASQIKYMDEFIQQCFYQTQKTLSVEHRS